MIWLLTYTFNNGTIWEAWFDENAQIFLTKPNRLEVDKTPVSLDYLISCIIDKNTGKIYHIINSILFNTELNIGPNYFKP